jgi:hypothetical protein
MMTRRLIITAFLILSSIPPSLLYAAFQEDAITEIDFVPGSHKRRYREAATLENEKEDSKRSRAKGEETPALSLDVTDLNNRKHLQRWAQQLSEEKWAFLMGIFKTEKWTHTQASGKEPEEIICGSVLITKIQDGSLQRAIAAAIEASEEVPYQITLPSLDNGPSSK